MGDLTALGRVTDGFEQHIAQAGANHEEHPVKDAEENGVIRQEPGNVLRKRAMDGFSETYHSFPLTVWCL